MKAVSRSDYGGPEVLRLSQLDRPIPGDKEILLRVHASSVNRTDIGFLRGTPYIARLYGGLPKPRFKVLGNEFAGVVEQAGRDVTLFNEGDRVFGFDDGKFGGHAEYKTIAEDGSVALMPNGASFEQMAAATEGSHYALSYIRVMEKMGAKRVLVHGATGGIGSAAVQLLKRAGMHVVATSTTEHVKLVESLGADEVIDWQREDFTAYGGEKFDSVFDSVGKSSFRACRGLLRKGGAYISTELGFMAQNPFLGLASPLLKLASARHVLFPLPKNDKAIIEFLKGCVEDGSFKPVIDRTYELEAFSEAFTYVDSGQKTGNAVLRVT